MKTRFSIVMMLLILPSLFAKNDGYADLVARIQDAVVSIKVTQEMPENQPRPQLFDQFFGQRPRNRGQEQAPQSAGTGFIISKDGYIVTNRHVVKDASALEVTLGNGSSYEAKVIGSDDSLDVALIKIDATDLTILTLGNSDEMRIGDIVLALGFPLQLGFSVTSGIVSGIGRNMSTQRFDVGSYLQTDADITFGNSGGPLLNTDGEVIAINTMIVSRGETYGFSIPSNLFMASVEQLRKNGKVERGALGVSIQSLDDESKEYYKVDNGAMISGITPGLAAEKAGIRAGDIILAIDNKQVKVSNDVISMIGQKSPNEEIKLDLLRDGKKIQKTLKLSNRSRLIAAADNGSPGGRPEAHAEDETGLGFSVNLMDDASRSELDIPKNLRGLLITHVEPNSLAARKGIRPGSILASIDRKPVTNMRDMKEHLAPLKENQVTSIVVLEENRDEPGEFLERTVILRKK